MTRLDAGQLPTEKKIGCNLIREVESERRLREEPIIHIRFGDASDSDL